MIIVWYDVVPETISIGTNCNMCIFGKCVRAFLWLLVQYKTYTRITRHILSVRNWIRININILILMFINAWRIYTEICVIHHWLNPVLYDNG